MNPIIADDGRRRWCRIGQNAGAQTAARIVSGLCQLVLVPIMLGMFGPELFGWIMALVALVGVSQFGDLGVAIALQQRLSEAEAAGEAGALPKIYASGVRLLWRLAVVWLALAPLACWLGPAALAPPETVGGFTAAASWLLVVVAAAIGIPLSAGPRLAAARQLSWVNAAAAAVVNVVTVLVITFLSRAQVSQPALVVAILAASQLVPSIITFRLLRGSGFASAARPDANEITRLWHAGRKFAAPNLAGGVLQAITPTFFGELGGYQASANFAVLQRLFGLIQQLHAIVLGPFWPAYAEARGRGEWQWLRRSFRLSLVVTAVAGLAVTAAAILMPSITRVWLRGRPLPEVGLTWWIAAWVVTMMVVQAFSYFLLGLSRLDRIAPALAIVQVATLVAMGLLGKLLGGWGVAAALAAGALIGLLPLLMRESSNTFRELKQKESTSGAMDVTL